MNLSVMDEASHGAKVNAIQLAVSTRPRVEAWAPPVPLRSGIPSTRTRYGQTTTQPD